MLPQMTDRRALLRKLENVEAFPLIALQALPELRADLDAVEAEALLRARELGASLEDIAEALVITRQGVAYKLKALAGNGHDDDEEGGAEEIVDVRELHTTAPEDEPEAQRPEPEARDSDPEPEAQERDPKAREPRTDIRVPQIDPPPPHTKA